MHIHSVYIDVDTDAYMNICIYKNICVCTYIHREMHIHSVYIDMDTDAYMNICI